jgi:hypothetical protein
VKCADDRVLPTAEGMVMEDTINRLIETGRCHGMEMNMEKAKVIRISRQSSPVQIRTIKTGECGTFQLFG